MPWTVSYITNDASKTFYKVRAINNFFYAFSFAFMLGNVFPTWKSNKYFSELLSKYSMNKDCGQICPSNVELFEAKIKFLTSLWANWYRPWFGKLNPGILTISYTQKWTKPKLLHSTGDNLRNEANAIGNKEKSGLPTIKKSKDIKMNCCWKLLDNTLCKYYYAWTGARTSMVDYYNLPSFLVSSYQIK